MKKSLLFGLVASLGLIGCTRSQEIDVPDANLSLFARTESPADTKTIVESGVHVYWEPGDEIAVFMGEQSAKFTTDITSVSGTATFKGTFGDATWPEDLDLWAVYPFSEDAVFDGETITTTLPSEQVAREGSFGKDMNLAIAHSNSSTLQFYNVGGGIRFSVTEEGIKKVMFEGLSGEIISGKVKIGMDENGKPVVQEVTGGSQFITLLPPSRQETFEPGTWYYIVAIPGSLEGGYKLRFYKDSDYARKVSEKAVVIKRSIFGSLEKADEGIEYEATTTHFPETEEEIVASIMRIETIAEQTKDIVDNVITNNAISDEATLINELSSIEGVIKCTLSETKDVAFLMLRDSVYVNVRLIIDNTKWGGGNFGSNISELSSRTKLADGATASKKALILSPFQSEDEDKGFYAVMTSYLESILSPLGFHVDPFIDKEVEIDHFCGDFLKQYDLVLITSHGNYNLTVNGELCSAIDSGERVSLGSKVIRFFNRDSDISFAIAKGVATYAATSLWMEKTTTNLCETTFKDNSLVILQSCYSYYSDEFYNFFIKHGVSAFGGFNPEADKQVSKRIVTNLLRDLCCGVDFRTAAEYVRNNDPAVLDIYEQVKAEQGDSPNISPKSFHFTPNSSYFIVDSHPKQLEHKVNSDGKHSFSWEMAPSWGSYLFDIIIDGEKVGDDLAINDSYDLSDTPTILDRQLSFSFVPSSFTPSNKKHTWSVTAKVYVDGIHYASYRTDGEDFTVTEEIHYETPEAMDLGLPSGLKWASFNLGATVPGDYGYYYAWGETEPYYSSENPLVWKEGKEAGYDWPSYKWCKGTEDTITKYCFESSYGYNGFTDGKTILDPEDDAAYVNLGGKWRMPTDAEMTELRESCTWKWTSRDGVNGVDVIGPNGNYIFLPAAGCRDWTFLGYVPTYGFYWSSSIRTDSPKAWGVSFDSDHVSRFTGSRQMGNSIRPVYGNPDQRPRISVSPTVINYGDVMVGEWLGNETGRVIFSNTGGADLSISRIWCPEGFSHSPSLTFPIVLSPGDSKTITFAFKPTEVKSYHGYLVIYSNASNDDGRVYVNGNGVE